VAVSRLRRLAPPAVLAAVFLVQAEAARREAGVTFDETYFLGAAQRAWRTGDFSAFPENHAPPLPILIAYAPAAFGEAAAARFASVPAAATSAALFRGQVQDPLLVGRARLASLLLFGLPLVLGVHAWLARRAGAAVAFAAAGLLALSPSLVAHSALATADVAFALASLVLLLAAARQREGPTAARTVALGVALGMALATKLAALAWLPILIACLARGVAREPRRVLGRVALAGALALAVWWGAHGFALATAAGRRLPAPMASVLVLQQESQGRDQFLFGERSRQGFRDYFLWAFLLKSTPAELAVAALVLLWAVRRRGALSAEERLGLAALGCFAVATAFAPFGIGQRHVLVAYPLLACLLGCAARSRRRTGALVVVGAALLGGQAAAAGHAWPRPLAYFNAFGGGREGGHLRLVDSNLDWGQDLPRVAPAAARLGCSRVGLFYFGTARPEAYGLRAVDGAAGCVAVSATLLHGVHVPDDRFFAFRRLREDGRAGDSIFLYRVGAPGVAAALARAESASGDYGAETVVGVFDTAS